MKGNKWAIIPEGWINYERPYTPAIVWDKLVFISGQLPSKSTGSGGERDIREDALLVLKQIRDILEEAGSSLENVLKVTVYLSRMEDLPAFNEVYEEFFQPPLPARTAVQAQIPGGHLLEVDAIAFIDKE